MVVVAATAAILAVGSLHPTPPPIGLARAGLIVYDSGGDIVVVDPDGSNRRDLTSTPTLETSPIFSPDGSMIAYWAKQTAGMPAALWVMGADGSGRHNLTGTTDFAGSANLQAAWSPDSRRLAFSVGYYYSSTQLFVVQADGTDLHAVGGASLARSDPAWSPDGRLIAFRGHTIGLLPDDYPADLAIGVYVITPDGAGEREVSQSGGAGGAPNCACFGGPYVGTAPSWSPDGGSILYATGLPGHHALAIAAPAVGSTERIIDLPAGDYLLPAFSPDGSRIAFEQLSPAGDHATALVVDADGSGLHSLGGGAPIAPNPLFWSPDGLYVITYTVDLSEIRISEADGHAPAGSRTAPSIALGAFSANGFPERASWQRLPP